MLRMLQIVLGSAVLLVGCRSEPSLAAEPSLAFVAGEDPTQVKVVLQGLAAAQGQLDEREGRSWLTVHLEDSGVDQPLTGRYELRDGALVFTPAFRLQPGRRYIARSSGPGTTLQAEYGVPARPPAPPPTIAAIHPDAEQLPANQLKFYLEFSRPMRTGPQVFEHIELVDLETGDVVPQAFRELELWSSDRRELTLLFHPGRVKREIPFAAELGPVLHPGRRYLLRLGTGLADGEGAPMARPFELRFTAGPADEDRPDPRRWQVSTPTAGTTELLVVTFDERLDWGFLRKALSVHDPSGAKLVGESSIGADERSFRFAPEAPWSPGIHHLVLGPDLADLAGNTPSKLFDQRIDERLEPVPLELPFAPTDRAQTSR